MTSFPIRSCIGCGARRPQRDLLRLVVGVGGEVDLDFAGSAGGRGAYLCPRVDCLWEAKRRNRFGRVLRVPSLAVDEEVLARRIVERLGELLASRVRTAFRQRRALGAAAAQDREGPIALWVRTPGSSVPTEAIPQIELGVSPTAAKPVSAGSCGDVAITDAGLAEELLSIECIRKDFGRPPARRPGGQARSRKRGRQPGQPNGANHREPVRRGSDDSSGSRGGTNGRVHE